MLLERKGDLEMIAQNHSISIINNWGNHIPKFCFIIPTYRRAELLQFALDSILAIENPPDFEMLVVDDNPQRGDETELLMVEKYDIPGMAYYKNSSNLKQEGNWNKLFALSRAEWLVMLHDDDMLYPDYFKYLVKAMNAFGTNYGGFFPMFIGHEFTDNQLPDREKCNIKARVIKEVDFLQGCILGAPVGMCLKRSVITAIGGVNNNSGVAVDYDFYNRLIRVTDVVKMYGYPTGVWRMMANVSQHKSTVLTCVEYGDVLKRETLKDLKLSFFSNIYECYIRAFDRQHVQSWFAEMKKGQPLEDDLKKCSIIDICVYKMIRLFLTILRHVRLQNKKISIE